METLEFDLDSLAIKALGSRFKLTEVFLRDDGFPIDDNRIVSSFPKHIRFKYDDDEKDANVDVNDDCFGKISSVSNVEMTEESVLMKEDDEMSALGLPLSFLTSKKSSAQTKGKHKPIHHKDQDIHSRLKDRVLVSPKKSEERQSYAEFLDKPSYSSSLLSSDQAEHSCSGLDVSNNTRLSKSCDQEQPANVAGNTGCSSLEFNIYGNVPRNMLCEALIDDLPGTDIQIDNMTSIAATSNLSERNTCHGGYALDDCVKEIPKEMNRNLMERVDTNGAVLNNAMQLDGLDSSMCIEQTLAAGMPVDSYMVLDHDANDNSILTAVCGEWSAFWDSFYMRYYFYNTKSKESTWYPPPGMESYAYGDVFNTFDESLTEAIETNVDPSFSQNEGQFDTDVVDKACFDEQTGGTLWGAQNLTTENISSDSAMPSETPCKVKLYDQHVLDGICLDEITSLSTVRSPKREQEDSSGLCTGGLPSNNDDSIDNPCENANENYYDYVRPQLSNASSLGSIVKAVECDDDLINHVNMEDWKTEAGGFRVSTPAATKTKTKRNRRRRKKSINNNDHRNFQPVEEKYVDITKYWCQRYLLFSKFDDGIQMDEEGWFSVTPEALARHHASRSGGGVVVDCFTGVGGNAIQFAKMSKHVIAIDVDPNKIDYAHHNAAIYGVEDRIDFIIGDSFSVAPSLKADTVFLSPPWGGPDYIKVKSYDITMLQPYDGQFLFDTFKVTASQIIMFLPKNVDIVQLAELSLSAKSPWSLEVEKNFLNGTLKAVTAYFRKIS